MGYDFIILFGSRLFDIFRPRGMKYLVFGTSFTPGKRFFFALLFSFLPSGKVRIRSGKVRIRRGKEKIKIGQVRRDFLKNFKSPNLQYN